MRGTSHAVSGAAAGCAVGFAAPSTALSLVCVAVAAVAALGPDIDHPGSRASNVFGPVSRAVCWSARGCSRVVGLPAHRGLTHTAVAAVAAGAAVAVVLLVVAVPVLASVFVGVAVTVGWLTALAGDWITKTSLPHLWWPFAECKGPPKALRITTGKLGEAALVWLVFVPATVYGLYAMLA